MFGTIRIALACILLVGCVLVIQHAAFRRRKIAYTIGFAVVAAVYVISNFFPFENAFVSFPSAQSALEYYCGRQTSAELVVEGVDTDFAIGNKEDSYVYLIVPKTDDGWKVGVGADTKMVRQVTIDSIICSVYQYKDTGESYISVLNTAGGQCDIMDNTGSEFYSVNCYDPALDTTFYTYYAFVPDIAESYTIVVNDTEIPLFEV